MIENNLVTYFGTKVSKRATHVHQDIGWYKLMSHNVTWENASFAPHSHPGGWDGLVIDRQEVAFVDGLESGCIADIYTAQDTVELLIVE